MNIGIELRYLVLGASGGISQLVKGVCERMFQLNTEHTFFVFCTPFNRRLLSYENPRVKYFSLSPQTFFQRLDQLAIEVNIDVLFRSFPSEDRLYFPCKRQVILIPDLQHEFFPDFFTSEVLEARRKAFNYSLRNGGAIGTISEFARSTLVGFPKTQCQDIFMMPPALQKSHTQFKGEKSLNSDELCLLPDKDYLLYPANLWPHKNHISLLKAFEIFLNKTGHDCQLILTGHPQGWTSLAAKFPSLPVSHLGFVSPQLLRALLEKSKALTFFSLYEGFGMPLLEAFDAGTPVICSDVTSLPEVGGDAVLSCDPNDVNAIASLIETVVFDSVLRKALVAKGKTRLSLFSWDQSAKNLLRACVRVAGETISVGPKEEATQYEDLPLVSIVTPSYNQGLFLRRTIDSVLNQTYPNVEYLVIDGNSTDKSIEILRSYGDQFYWISEPDKGQTNAINKGLARAKGEILAYLNSDDVLFPNAIEQVVNFFRKHPDCDLVYGDASYVDENDHVIGQYNTAPYSFERLLQDCMICQPATFWSARITKKIGMLDETLNFVMDYDYWLRIARNNGKIYYFPEHLACSRLYPETKTLSSRTSIYQEIFQTSQKHAGRVHESYFHGYWHHLVFEKIPLLRRWLRPFPHIHHPLAKLHYEFSIGKKRFFQRLKEYKNLKENLLFKGRQIKLFFKKAIRQNKLESKSRAVTGYWPDNWLEPKVNVRVQKSAVAKEFYIGGLPAVDQEIFVYLGTKKVLDRFAYENQYCDINFTLDVQEDSLISLKFSSFLIDGSGRKLSFFLQDTNLFAEQDLS